MHVEEMSKPKKWLFTIAAFMTTIAIMGEMGIMPFVNNLYEAFPNNVIAVSYVVSSASIFVVLATLITTLLMKKIGKKTLLIAGCTIFMVSSLSGLIINDVRLLMVSRSLMGIGEGMVNVIIMAIIAEIYLDANKRAAFLGYYNAFMTLVGAAMSYASGILAEGGWHGGFNVYWPTILMTIGVILFIPAIENSHGMSINANQSEEPFIKKPLGKLFWFFILDYVIFTMMYGIFSFFISIYVKENSLGSSGFAGQLIAVSSISGFIVAILFGKIYSKLKKSTVIPSIIMAIAGLTLLYFAPSEMSAYICSILLGVSYGIYFTYSYAYTPEIVPLSRIDDAIGLTTAFYGTAYSVVTYIVVGCMRVTSGFVTPVYMIFACLGVVALVVELLTTKMYKNMLLSE